VTAATPAPVPAATGALHGEVAAILAALAVVLGARVGEHLPGAADTIPAAALVAAPAVMLFPARRLRSARRVIGLVALAALGAVSMARALAGLDGVPARLAADDVDGRVTVRLAADPQGQWTGVRVPARLEAVAAGEDRSEPERGVPGRSGALAAVESGKVSGTVLVVAKGAAAERLRLLEAGESAVLLGGFRPLRAGERQWRFRHAGAVFEADDLVGAGRVKPALLRAGNAVRHRVLAGGAGLGDTDRALVAGFLVGDDRDLPPGVSAEFRAAGLSHLLVVSGANVTLALALVGPVLRRLGLLGRLAGGLAVLVVFCAMARFEPSVLRAGAMAGLALVAAFLGRPAPGLRVLALAVTGLVLIDPFLTHSLGFGLSCGASAGILLLSRPISGRLPGPRLVRESLGITASAQVGVAPIALPAFGHLPLVALPANLAAAPPAAALSLWGLGSGLAGGLLGPAAGPAGSGPAALLQVPTAVLAGWIRSVAHLAARCPLMIGPRPAALLGIVALVGWWRSGSGADLALPAVGRAPRRQVDLQADGVVDGEEARPGDHQRGGDHGVEQVELEAPALAGRAQQAEVPLHLGHDQQHLDRDEAAPDPGE
jgi:competence protein ComEC